MSRRIFVRVNRGMTDATAVCIYPWERDVLQLVHGQDCEEVTIDQMCSMKDVVRVEKVKLNHSNQFPPSLREQLIAMATVDPEADPALEPESEYGRMVEKYGMDKDLPIPCVTRVYGEYSSGAFTAKLRKYAEEAAPPITVDTMTVSEIRDELKRRGIRFPPEANKTVLRELLSGEQVTA